MKRSVELELEYQPPIVSPPQASQAMAASTSANDASTIAFWKDIWLRNMKSNKERVGSFKDKGVHLLHDLYRWKPAICIGSGPSLKQYAKFLVRNDEEKIKGNPGIPVISALHNFAYLTDLGVHVDYWVTLDAGEIVIDEMFDGGTNTQEFYREKSKSQKLIAYVATNPRLFNNWLGDTYWMQSIMPDPVLGKAMDEIERYKCIVSSGGNVLGGSMYIAKAIMGCNPIIYMGADCSFSYDKKFHSFNSKYDTVGHAIKVPDIYGNNVLTWSSYYNFKTFFDLKAMTVPGIWINCSDGCVGAYPQGNLIAFQYMHIEKALEMYRVSEHLQPVVDRPDTIEQEIICW